MSLPFSEEQFLGVFAEYNRAVWPAQLFLYALAAAAIFLAARRRRHSGKVIAAILALFWLWMGVVYHLAFFAGINRAALVFGALFILQSLLFCAEGVRKRPLTFRFRADARGFFGATLFIYALVVYPLLGYLFGHTFPAAPTFGLPCPTTIFTFGMLLWVEGKVPVRLLLVPLGWSLLGTTAAVMLGMTEDLGLTAAGVLGTALIVSRNRRATGADRKAAVHLGKGDCGTISVVRG
jgi:hypothetical protein